MLLISYISNFFPICESQCCYICMAIQQIGTYHDILEKARNISNNKFSLKN
jgi:hypothetical protein